jgi:hypothetical protein
MRFPCTGIDPNGDWEEGLPNVRIPCLEPFMREIRDDRLTLRVSDLPPGLYSVIVRSADGHWDRVSFVKTR